MSIRSSLFGRRTMWFFASAEPKSPPTVFIKDAWPVAFPDSTDDNPRNEIVLLRRIHGWLSVLDPGVPYPKLKMGGTVRQRNHGQWEEDTATVAYGSIEAALPLRDLESPTRVHRVHWRMVMTPIADRLNTLNNFYELIVVLADAMACHEELYWGYRIFHRDISTSNVMVVREDDDHDDPDITANSGDFYDPLKARAKYEKDITRKCYEVLQDISLEARAALVSLSS
ncbi:hypothetical protein H4R34_004351 [Dimargaris verticillata]|uniref:Fungal-type protein kinase domain-containing protein n=1 Tax=Dimargaris verticillata TaxID=2761393 RepID=A0A9W8AZ11_9FUNG|nr:hypothetical protein H4R34_004351 [Dimargaris verticillata]